MDAHSDSQVEKCNDLISAEKFSDEESKFDDDIIDLNLEPIGMVFQLSGFKNANSKFTH